MKNEKVNDSILITKSTIDNLIDELCKDDKALAHNDYTVDTAKYALSMLTSNIRSKDMELEKKIEDLKAQYLQDKDKMTDRQAEILEHITDIADEVISLQKHVTEHYEHIEKLYISTVEIRKDIMWCEIGFALLGVAVLLLNFSIFR